MRKEVEKVLARVLKPARYIDCEMNVIRKNVTECAATVVLAFPDVYEIGMSYHGYKILYEQINAHVDYAAERTFAPWTDMEYEMRKHNLLLYSLESFHPVRDFDIIGFTLQHELNYTNVINMLDLAGIKVGKEDRQRNTFPLIIAGGLGALSPEPLADFIDLFVIGDGEEVIIDILRIVAEFKKSPLNKDNQENKAKRHLLKILGSTRGVYVPEFYEPIYNPDGTLKYTILKEEGLLRKIERRTYDFTGHDAPVNPPVPLMQIVHDRYAVEIRRGCTCGCRFCNAGMLYRPVRERTPKQIMQICRKAISNSGYSEISLLSLSSGDYSKISQLTKEMQNEFTPQHIAVSLPSLRISSFDVELAAQQHEVRKTGLTFAPEAGTERLRQVINKYVRHEELLEIINNVLRKGWHTVKLYFMIGLPTEQDEDIEGIIDLVNEVKNLARNIRGKKFQLNVSLSPFVPKAHTPFQWEPQPERKELLRRMNHILKRTKSKNVNVTYNNIDQSFLEAVFSRGDRRLGAALKTAWQLGCRFDNWGESLKFEQWNQAFKKHAIIPEWYANRQRNEDEHLPWDHIDSLVSREFLWRERQLAMEQKLTPDCTVSECYSCGVCNENVKNDLASHKALKTYNQPEPISSSTTSSRPLQRMRLTYSKKGPLRFISHLDLVRTLKIVFRRADLRLAYSSGFHPQPRIQLCPPLPLFYESEVELLDVFLQDSAEPPSLRNQLNRIAPEGMQFSRAIEVSLRDDSLDMQILASEFELSLPPEWLREIGINNNELKEKVINFLAEPKFTVTLTKKGNRVDKDLKASLLGFTYCLDDNAVKFTIISRVKGKDLVTPLLALSKILETEVKPENVLNLKRTAFHYKNEGINEILGNNTCRR